MTDQPAAAVAALAPRPALEPDAINDYRRRITASPRDAITLGILPAAAGFLAWIIAESMRAAPAPQNWSLAGILAVGLILMAIARLGLRSPFFALTREHDPGIGR
jgi:hypothetical protein